MTPLILFVPVRDAIFGPIDLGIRSYLAPPQALIFVAVGDQNLKICWPEPTLTFAATSAEWLEVNHERDGEGSSKVYLA